MTDPGMLARRRRSGPEIALRPIRPGDLDRVLAIERRVADRGWSRGIFETEIADHRTRCYLAAWSRTPDSATIVGYGGIQVLADEAHVTTLTVDPDRRRRGIASRLLAELLREARAHGAVSATLEVRIDNHPAQRLYATFGFRPVGIRPRYYQGTVDALIMWAHDVGGAEFGRMLRTRDPRATGPRAPVDRAAARRATAARTGASRGGDPWATTQPLDRDECASRSLVPRDAWRTDSAGQGV